LGNSNSILLYRVSDNNCFKKIYMKLSTLNSNSSRHGISGITVNILSKKSKIGFTLLTSILPFATILIDMRLTWTENKFQNLTFECQVDNNEWFTSQFFEVTEKWCPNFRVPNCTYFGLFYWHYWQLAHISNLNVLVFVIFY
jgi:hypothetical protein